MLPNRLPDRLMLVIGAVRPSLFPGLTYHAASRYKANIDLETYLRAF
jgi:hypothetical protein